MLAPFTLIATPCPACFFALSLGPPIAWYPGRRDALGPGPSHPPFSQRLAPGDYSPSGVMDFYTNMGMSVREAVVLNAGGHSMGGADKDGSGWDGEPLAVWRGRGQVALGLVPCTCLPLPSCTAPVCFAPPSRHPGSFTPFDDAWPSPSIKHLLDLLRYGWTTEVVEETSRVQVLTSLLHFRWLVQKAGDLWMGSSIALKAAAAMAHVHISASNACSRPCTSAVCAGAGAGHHVYNRGRRSSHPLPN